MRVTWLRAAGSELLSARPSHRSIPPPPATYTSTIQKASTFREEQAGRRRLVPLRLVVVRVDRGVGTDLVVAVGRVRRLQERRRLGRDPAVGAEDADHGHPRGHKRHDDARRRRHAQPQPALADPEEARVAVGGRAAAHGAAQAARARRHDACQRSGRVGKLECAGGAGGGLDANTWKEHFETANHVLSQQLQAHIIFAGRTWLADDNLFVESDALVRKIVVIAVWKTT
mmetsp:Transcript_58916/g.156003  ORF Transcript_58916/g.156003 Transcript_58916/m.156003 type:complete len:229 (-) Transcript_58916:335-1021(-)